MTSRIRDRVADVRSVVIAHMPDYQVDCVVRLGEGLDNLAYEVNGELVVRFSKEPDLARRAALLNHEARVLAAVADVSPLPVPQPAFTVAEQGCLAYFKLPGVPLVDMPRHQRSAHGTSIGATLGELLTALHAVAIDRMAVETDHQPMAGWRHEATENYVTVAGQVPAAQRRSVEAFLDAAPPHDGCTPTFSHNDLGIEHVLVDPVAWTVTGIIDWSDAAVVDPAPATSGCSTAISAPRLPAPPSAPIEPTPTTSRLSASVPCSMPGAVSSRIWHTASRRNKANTSTRALPRWNGCSRHSRLVSTAGCTPTAAPGNVGSSAHRPASSGTPSVTCTCAPWRTAHSNSVSPARP